ncbi:PREDICTED: sodium-coupled monocarboxylate transporter 1-like [Dinoponera quadriceps]|uniref:Sodium-coupled monocarboxylate transporter 1-like n=1 Tax=Dinoponera quadriceps TaxID=609295 RepID=A0A6P3Y9R6_DINQU|nr:PREDICTED: sodium-coupled monocarboxylate transporter 1-like [Dinoponera quadriceps]XP_014486747.1 PREDICTED: sodium-coupled monocarboxylate transporter 1-like [Dinoponera quadriceps]XP_014486753.1 PREDICTED: sodium-coupled monocarboxylate transporter 1-like [Dinoponera quadriceps]XP_014486761.1 PREDICTED: sodium-coupled monocarboxylate transporter 1-like [Dinoponera quadriceps]XP_014486770.1 PREDICTED: sodium-coupled monocarboxylate transporter 1-like [Dinoponera quadriceps]
MVVVSERGYFHWIDWLVFALMLVVSAAAGLWHFRRAQKSNTQDYLLGGKSLGLFPVSASLVASFISGVTILGTPAEIYNFGTQYWITIISILFCGLVVATVYLPVFTTLRLSSVYEYLEIRFSRAVRILISFIFVFDVILYQSIVVYVPALALNQVSGIDIHLIGTIVCAVCVFYTVLGGIRAVVWTDALQVGVMVAAVISVTALGTYQLGGVSEVWNRATEVGRIEFLNFDPSPYTRHTVWTVLFGSWLYCTAYISVNQTMVQRYRSLESTRMSQWSIALFTVGIMVFISLCCWCGLVLIAWWSPPKCDPRASGLITADDQLLPAYVMEIAHHLHGIPGLFVAGIFGAALSSLSVGLNSTSVVILEDFVKGCFKMKPSERCSGIFVKLLVVLLGLLALSFVFLVEKLGGVLSVTNSLAAVAAGTSFGVFTLGILFPWANSKGAFVGTIAGFTISGWASFGANAAIGSGVLTPRKLPVSHCGNVSEDFLKMFEYSDESNVFPLYRLSYHWFAPLGTVVVLLVGGLVTWITGARDPSSVDRTLLSPVIHRWLPQQKYSNGVSEWCQASVDQQVSADLFMTSLRRKSHPVVKRGEQTLANGSL